VPHIRRNSAVCSTTAVIKGTQHQALCITCLTCACMGQLAVQGTLASAAAVLVASVQHEAVSWSAALLPQQLRAASALPHERRPGHLSQHPGLPPAGEPAPCRGLGRAGGCGARSDCVSRGGTPRKHPGPRRGTSPQNASKARCCRRRRGRRPLLPAVAGRWRRTPSGRSLADWAARCTSSRSPSCAASSCRCKCRWRTGAPSSWRRCRCPTRCRCCLPNPRRGTSRAQQAWPAGA